MSSKKKRARRTFDEEFKRDAVNLVVKENYSIRGAAEALNVNESSLRSWYHKYAPDSAPCGPDATTDELRAELKRVRKQLREAELEREILKKATAYFAKESQ